MFLESTTIHSSVYTDRELELFLYGQFEGKVQIYTECDDLLFAFELEEDLATFRHKSKEYLDCKSIDNKEDDHEYEDIPFLVDTKSQEDLHREHIYEQLRKYTSRKFDNDKGYE